MKSFLASHTFGQRNKNLGQEQHLHHTHQGMDMLHEEVIRLQLEMLEKKKLVKNEKTGNYERDDDVFQTAARWLGHLGDAWFKNKGNELIYQAQVRII